MRALRRSALTTVLGFALLTGLAAGCGASGGETKETSATPKTPTAKPEPEVSSEGKKWGGWRWKGKRDNCFFLYESRCYDTLKRACQAAKCKKDACAYDDSAPAKVSCAPEK